LHDAGNMGFRDKKKVILHQEPGRGGHPI
jgi:hypothetical protein